MPIFKEAEPGRSKQSDSHKRGEGSFVQSQGAFLSNNFGDAVDDSIIYFRILRLCLKADFDDFKRLHDENLRPS